MKNKKLLYVLMVAVAAVWGIIFHRIFMVSGQTGDQKQAVQKPLISEATPADTITADTATLALNYPDPFLREAVSLDVVPHSSISETKPLPPPKPAVNWNAVSYTGYIVNPATKNIVSILAINGKEQMIAEGATASGVKLIRNYHDSVQVLFQNQTKFITKKP